MDNTKTKIVTETLHSTASGLEGIAEYLHYEGWMHIAKELRVYASSLLNVADIVREE